MEIASILHIPQFHTQYFCLSRPKDGNRIYCGLAVCVQRLFLMVPWVGLQSVIAPLPGHIPLLLLVAVLCLVAVCVLFCLFDLILYVPSTIFQLNRDGSSCVEPVLS